jgi:uncharacterized protein YndB with AHSA1/START domain
MAQVEPLRVTRVFDAPRALVFHAWTDVEELKRWFCPFEHWGLEVEADARFGGAYRIAMRDPDAKRDHIARGMYKEVRAPERLVFSWRLDTDPSFPETLVTVEFRDLGGKTEVTLTHEGLPTPDLRERHAHGWKGCLDRLAKAL